MRTDNFQNELSNKEGRNPGCQCSISQKRFRTHLFRDSNSCERCGVTRQQLIRENARARSTRLDAFGKVNFALIKSADFDAKSGDRLTALSSANRLLECGFWPLWDNTPGRLIVRGGDQICVYLSGESKVIAKATVGAVHSWSRVYSDRYPLVLGGVPEFVLTLESIEIFPVHISVANRIDTLQCVGANKKKWGTAFCGGMRTLTPHDFNVLTNNGDQNVAKT